jgi:hypothetical protein
MFDSDPGNDVPNHMVGDPFDWTFRNRGSFTYYCKVHPFTMKGRVNVGPQPNPPAGGNQPPSGNSPNQNPQSGGADTTAPVVSRLRVSGGRTCRGVRHCHKRPTRVSFTLSEAAKVRVSLKRRGGRSPAAISMGGKAGANKLSLSTRRVPPGRYTVTLRATDDAGNPSKRASATFRVR